MNKVVICSPQFAFWGGRLQPTNTRDLAAPGCQIIGGYVVGNHGDRRRTRRYGHIVVDRCNMGIRMFELEQFSRILVGGQHIRYAGYGTGLLRRPVRDKENNATLVVPFDIVRMKAYTTVLAYVALGKVIG
jgi:hypothetical protein